MSAALPAAVAAFCAAHGVLPPVIAQPLRTGRNSEVQRLQHAGGLSLLKRYFQHPADRRDRLGTEFRFLSLCQQHGLVHVPQALAMDRELNCALYSFLPGQRPAVPHSGHIAQAAQFILALNGLRGNADAAALPLASDACLSIEAHLALADSRIERLLQVQPDGAVAAEACAFVRATLEPAWRKLDAAARAAFAPDQLAAELPPAQRILSPSDFGFHNSLDHEDVLAFVEVEYAGWDDAAKLLCDFQCQPELPVTAQQGAQFCAAVLAGLGNDGATAQRVALLLPLHRIKWCCILLNELRSEDRQRRLHAGVDANALLETQLAKARQYFQTHLAIFA
jgi:hypothetical protein